MKTDVIIIGCGPAGAAAAVYTARAGLASVVFEGGTPGGQVSLTDKIDNYPGFDSIEGWELATKLDAQVRACGAQLRYEKVKAVDLANKSVTTAKGEYSADAIIVATGAKRRTLGLQGEERFTGRGISYCAVCDGGFYKDKTVAVVGGGNTALGDAIYLSRIAAKVYLIHRRDEFRAAPDKQRQLAACENVETILSARVTALSGANKLEGATLDVNGEARELVLDGIFVAIGTEPESGLLTGLELDAGQVVTNERMETSLAGVFAAGDIRRKEVRQIVTAASDGAVAAISAAEYIEKIRLGK